MSTSQTQRHAIRGMLADLKMPGSLETIDASDAISRLLSAQISLRNNRRLQAAMRSARLPAIKTLQQLDFSFQPSIEREQIESLHELGFIRFADVAAWFRHAKIVVPVALPMHWRGCCVDQSVARRVRTVSGLARQRAGGSLRRH